MEDDTNINNVINNNVVCDNSQIGGYYDINDNDSISNYREPDASE